MSQKEQIENQLARVDESLSERLEQRLVILELPQKAADLYAKKKKDARSETPDNFQTFEELSLKGGVLSVKYSSFAKAIAFGVRSTQELTESKK